MKLRVLLEVGCKLGTNLIWGGCFRKKEPLELEQDLVRKHQRILLEFELGMKILTLEKKVGRITQNN